MSFSVYLKAFIIYDFILYDVIFIFVRKRFITTAYKLNHSIQHQQQVHRELEKTIVHCDKWNGNGKGNGIGWG